MIFPLLIEFFAQHFAQLNFEQINVWMTNASVSYPWRSNLGQLSNVVERVAVVCRGPLIRIGDLPADLHDLDGETPRRSQP